MLISRMLTVTGSSEQVEIALAMGWERVAARGCIVHLG
jgi:hypothetical protein